MTNPAKRELSIEDLLVNIEANLQLFGTTVIAGVEQPFHLAPCLDQALTDTRMALEKIRSIDPVILKASKGAP